VKAARKPEAFVGWIDEFYGKHAAMVEENLRPLLDAWHAAFPVARAAGEDWPAASAARHVERSREELLRAAECKADQLAWAVEKTTLRWTSERLAEIGSEFQNQGA
jgi:hypothetical protein